MWAWARLHGAQLKWPVQVLDPEKLGGLGKVAVYCQSDDAEFMVKSKDLSTKDHSIVGIDVLKKRKKWGTLSAFRQDLQWVGREFKALPENVHGGKVDPPQTNGHGSFDETCGDPFQTSKRQTGGRGSFDGTSVDPFHTSKPQTGGRGSFDGTTGDPPQTSKPQTNGHGSFDETCGDPFQTYKRQTGGRGSFDGTSGDPPQMSKPQTNSERRSFETVDNSDSDESLSFRFNCPK